MGGKLVKREDHWALYNEDGHKIAATIPGCNSKLSIKNCEAIENGYDLDELLDGLLINRGEHFSRVRNPLYGEERQLAKDLVQKALELIGDKKFSEEDIIKAYNTNHPTPESKDFNRESFIQSLKQTEWDVEVVMLNGFDDINDPKPFSVPKLDKNGCLILKRK